MAVTAQLGDRVAFSSHFLRSMGERPTSPRWGDRGVVASETDCDILVIVRWDDGRENTVNRANLRCVNRGAGLLEETPAALRNAWVGMGFAPIHSANGQGQ